MREILNNRYFEFILILLITCSVSIYTYINAKLYLYINDLSYYTVYPLIILTICIIILLINTNYLKRKIQYWSLIFLAIGCLLIYNYEKPNYTYQEALDIVKEKEKLNHTLIAHTETEIYTKRDNGYYQIYKILGKSNGINKYFSFDPYSGQIYELE